MMSIFCIVCKSFRVSSVIGSGYRFILLLYYHHFGSNRQTIQRIYPHRIDLHKDDVFFEYAYEKLASSYIRQHVDIFGPHPGQKVDLHQWGKKITSCRSVDKKAQDLTLQVTTKTAQPRMSRKQTGNRGWTVFKT